MKIYINILETYMEGWRKSFLSFDVLAQNFINKENGWSNWKVHIGKIWEI